MKQQFLLDAGESLDTSYLIRRKKEKNVEIKHYLVNDRDKKFNKDYRAGDHFILNFDNSVLYKESQTLEKIFAKTFRLFLNKYHKGGTILFIGLGNSSILGDSFGPNVVSQLIATNQYNDFLTIPKVALFIPDVTAKTGISSFKLIELVVEHLHPDMIILVDSFATNNTNYLDLSLEINDCGIAFADQLRSNKVIQFDTFHIPVLSIGYPCLLKKGKTYYTKYTLQEDLKQVAQVVAKVLNQVVLKQ